VATRTALGSDLEALLTSGRVLTKEAVFYLRDASRIEAPMPPDAVVLPGSLGEVEAVVRWAYRHDVPITPRGGGSGLAGGAVPMDGGIVLSLELLRGVRDLQPGAWRIAAEAGLTTAHVQRLARENGLCFPLNPGAAEQSQLGGNLATNAGGPRAFKYGPVRAFVTGVEAVVPPGELVTLGGAARKDVAGYDLAGLLIGSEGTLGVITAAWLRLLPAPGARAFLAGFFSSGEDLTTGLLNVFASGATPAAVEYLDGGALAVVAPTFPQSLGSVPTSAAGMILLEVDGSMESVIHERELLAEALGPAVLGEVIWADGPVTDELSTWRDSVSSAVRATRGEKMSEDICVPVDRFGEAVAGTVEIGHRHGLAACSWGHAGDGNLHSTFLISPDSEAERERADAAAEELFAMAISLGGTISGEHGLGAMKNGYLRKQWGDTAIALHRQVKSTLDPKGLMNPGKKLP
jgi:FAD/FMN-containing dehydrogenase